MFIFKLISTKYGTR